MRNLRVVLWAGPSQRDPLEIEYGLAAKEIVDGKMYARGAKLPPDYTAKDVEEAFGMLWNSLSPELIARATRA